MDFFCDYGYLYAFLPQYYFHKDVIEDYMNNDIPGCFDIHMFHPQLNIFLFHLSTKSFSVNFYPVTRETKRTNVRSVCFI